MEFTIGLKIDKDLVVAVDYNNIANTEAYGKVNTIFCPIGPACTRVTILVTNTIFQKMDLKKAHTLTIEFRQKDPNRAETLNIQGLYVKQATSLFPNPEKYPNSLIMLELVDRRWLIAQNSDTDKLVANIRSWAKGEPFLEGKVKTDFDADAAEGEGDDNQEGGEGEENGKMEWKHLVKKLWRACGLPAPDNKNVDDLLPQEASTSDKPDTLYFVGMNAWQALCSVLDYLNCAVRHNLFDNNYDIVYLDKSKQLPEINERYKVQHTKMPYSPMLLAKTLKIYYMKKFPHGQELDVPRKDNWAFANFVHVEKKTTDIEGAEGTKAVWANLQAVLKLAQSGSDEGELENKDDVDKVADNIVKRYKDRMQIDREHIIYSGVHKKLVPDGKIKAILIKSDDSGTTTEVFIDNRLVSDFESQLNKPSKFVDFTPPWENFMPPDLGRRTFPSYPHIVDVVKIMDPTKSPGEKVSPGPEGMFSGEVIRYLGNLTRSLGSCFLKILSTGDNADALEAVNYGHYGPARLTGTYKKGGEDMALPLYVMGDNGGAGEPIIAFQLQNWKQKKDQQADAWIIRWDAKNKKWNVTDEAIKVQDPSLFVDAAGGSLNPTEAQERARAMWTGPPGSRGFAKLVQGSQTSRDKLGKDVIEPAVYEIIFMQRFPMFVHWRIPNNRESFFTEEKETVEVLEAEGLEESNQVAWTFQFGNLTIKAGQKIEVYLPAGAWGLVGRGTTGLAVYNDREDRYEVVYASQMCIWAIAKLAQNMTGSSNTEPVNIKDIQYIQDTIHCRAPLKNPTKAVNKFALRGKPDDYVLIRFINDALKISQGKGDPSEGWIIVQVQHKNLEVIKDLRIKSDGTGIEADRRTISTSMVSATDPNWVKILDASECP